MKLKLIIGAALIMAIAGCGKVDEKPSESVEDMSTDGADEIVQNEIEKEANSIIEAADKAAALVEEESKEEISGYASVQSAAEEKNNSKSE